MTPREIADHIEIGQVIQRYGRALDTADYELLRTVFAPDATLRYEMEGRRSRLGIRLRVRTRVCARVMGFTVQRSRDHRVRHATAGSVARGWRDATRWRVGPSPRP